MPLYFYLPPRPQTETANMGVYGNMSRRVINLATHTTTQGCDLDCCFCSVQASQKMVVFWCADKQKLEPNNILVLEAEVKNADWSSMITRWRLQKCVRGLYNESQHTHPISLTSGCERAPLMDVHLVSVWNICNVVKDPPHPSLLLKMDHLQVTEYLWDFVRC